MVMQQALRRAALFAAFPLALTLAAGLAAQEDSARPAVAKSAQPSKAARAAVKRADAVLAKAKGKKGAARKAILAEAAAAYSKVMADFAAEPAGAAPASFKAAEIWRKQGDLAKARPLYQKSMELDRARYQARAKLQLAHIARRLKQADEALRLYREVATLAPGSARAHEARLWVGRCHEAAGDRDTAARAYRVAVDKAATGTQKIAACNRLANLLVKMAEFEAADDVIRRAARVVEDAQGKKGKAAVRTAKNLRKAFEGMSARRALQRARDKKSGAHEDAADVEKSRR